MAMVGDCTHTFCTVQYDDFFSKHKSCSDKRLGENKQKQNELSLDRDIVDIRGLCVFYTRRKVMTQTGGQGNSWKSRHSAFIHPFITTSVKLLNV